jgi:hypothetical protein
LDQNVKNTMVCRVNAKYGINCKGINLATVFPATWLNGTVAWLTAAPPRPRVLRP